MNKKYQFINRFPHWRGLGIYRPDSFLKFIYEWFLFLGWFEVRKWRDDINGKMRDYYKVKYS